MSQVQFLPGVRLCYNCYVSLLNIFDESIKNSSAVLLKNYFPNSINWQNTLDFIYKQSVIKNPDLKKKKNPQSLIDVVGNILTLYPFWLAPQTGNVWDDFPEIKDFIIKLNKDCGNEEDINGCSFYKKWDARECTCKSIWHSEGVKVSLSEKFIGDHSDPWDACYLQIIGKSFWKITGSDSATYELNEGDLLFFPKATSHEVWSEGPRMGLLVSSSKRSIFNL